MIAIVNYRAGNLTSVKLAFDTIGVATDITSDPARILAAERVVFPGVGAAGAAMANLRELGLVETIRTVVARGTPFLGICIGLQISFDFSEEDGGTPCLGLLPGRVIPFRPASACDKVPQMGWNGVAQTCPHPIWNGIASGAGFYFVHSYYPDPADRALVMGRTDYAGVTFASAVARGNFFATQFHPEKSGRIGMRLLSNFCAWTPSPTGASPC